MLFGIPTLKTIIARMDADADGRLDGTEPRLLRSLVGVVIRAAAGGIYGLYGLIGKVVDYVMPDTCPEWILLRWVAIFLKVGRKAATFSGGSIDAIGTNGAEIQAGEIWQRADGVEFTTDALTTIVAGVASVPVTAKEEGVDYNTATDVTFTLTAPIAGINSEATVDADGITGGADIEGVEPLRSRLLFVLRNPPQAGNANDYIVWATEVTGVTRAWSYPLEGGAGNVAVRFMMDDSYADGIPLAGDVTTVQDYIDPLHPASAILTVVAPVAVVLNFTIHVDANTQEVKDAVELELSDMILRDSQPGGTILLSHISEAISRAAGETDHVITVPAADVTHTTNQIATMGAITWN